MWNFLDYLKKIMILIGTTIQSFAYPYWHGSWFFSKNKNIKRNNTLAAIVTGFVAAMGVLCVTLPLLLSSDIMFSKLFGEILDYVNFATLFWVSLTFIAGFTLPYAFFSALCRYNLNPADEDIRYREGGMTPCPGEGSFPQGRGQRTEDMVFRSADRDYIYRHH